MKKVALLMNMIPHYRIGFFEKLAEKVDLLVILDTLIEADRDWDVDPDSFKFKVQVQEKSGIKYQKKRSDLQYSEARYFHFSSAVGKQLREFQPDLIVSCEFGLRSIRAMSYAKKHKVPIFLWWEGTRHTEAGEKRLKMFIRRYLCRRADGFWSNGTLSSEYIRDQGATAPIQEGMTGISTERYRKEVGALLPQREELRENLGLHGVVLLFVGTITGRKGVRPYLEAVELAHQRGMKDFSLLFVGDGYDREFLEAFAEEHQENFPVVVAGSVKQDDIYQYYAAADVFVLPTVLDNWPLVTKEAISSGLPQLISVYNGASADLGKDERLGKVFDPLDLEDCAAKVQGMVEAKPPRLDEAVVEHYASHYSPQGQADRGFASIAKALGLDESGSE